MNTFLPFVQGIRDSVREARTLAPAEVVTVAPASGPVVLLFSPHPDDECITGLLPLRLMRELGHQVVNVPVTFGSNVARQADRAAELANACAALGWRIDRPGEGYATLAVADVVALLGKWQPETVLFPHADDWNSRHIATHHIVVEALGQMGPEFCCRVIETEFWGAMADPNLMVEGDVTSVADLVAATSLHVGEVARNPYHLRLPAWMQDNVRRGGELVGGQGAAVPEFDFATLYRLRRWQAGRFEQLLERGEAIAMGASRLKVLF